jgi:plastocyanin
MNRLDDIARTASLDLVESVTVVPDVDAMARRVRHRRRRAATIVAVVVVVVVVGGAVLVPRGSSQRVSTPPAGQLDPPAASILEVNAISVPLTFEHDVYAVSSPGEVEIRLGGDTGHTLAIEEIPDLVLGPLAAGEVATGVVDLQAGTYHVYCAIPGHAEAGMVATIAVGDG